MMSKLTWHESFSVGDSTIDHQHQELFHLVNMLDAIIYSDNPHHKMDEMIAFLEHYVTHHFHDEETLMQHAHYPGYAQHKLEHEYFTAFVENLRSLFNQHHHAQIIFQIRMLIDKLVRHIKSEDVGLKGLSK